MKKVWLLALCALCGATPYARAMDGKEKKKEAPQIQTKAVHPLWKAFGYQDVPDFEKQVGILNALLNTNEESYKKELEEQSKKVTSLNKELTLIKDQLYFWHFFGILTGSAWALYMIRTVCAWIFSNPKKKLSFNPQTYPHATTLTTSIPTNSE